MLDSFVSVCIMLYFCIINYGVNMNSSNNIEILWSGPHFQKGLNEILESKKCNYDLLQVYGENSLLYINSINKLKSINFKNCNNFMFYIGKIVNMGNLSCKVIDAVSNLLVYSHNPCNNYKAIKIDLFDNLHIFNKGSFSKLFPEVSSNRWMNENLDFDEIF